MPMAGLAPQRLVTTPRDKNPHRHTLKPVIIASLSREANVKRRIIITVGYAAKQYRIRYMDPILGGLNGYVLMSGRDLQLPGGDARAARGLLTQL